MKRKRTYTVNVVCDWLLEDDAKYDAVPDYIERRVKVDGVEVYTEKMTPYTYYNEKGNQSIYAIEQWVRDARQLTHETQNREDRPAKHKKFVRRVQMFLRKIIS